MHQSTTLDELLADPMVQLVMSRDGVDPEELRDLISVKARPGTRASALSYMPANELPAAHVINGLCGMRAFPGTCRA